MSEDNRPGDPPYVIQPKAADEVRVSNGGSQVEQWMAGHYARAWVYRRKEASRSDGMAKPREIVFAVCAIESYLLEWSDSSGDDQSMSSTSITFEELVSSCLIEPVPGDLEGIVAKHADSRYKRQSSRRPLDQEPQVQSEGRAWGFIQEGRIIKPKEQV
jgi:hypothetical protein